MQSVGVFRANKAFALSSIGLLNNAKDSYVGYAEFYHANGKLKGIGNFSQMWLNQLTAIHSFVDKKQYQSNEKKQVATCFKLF